MILKLYTYDYLFAPSSYKAYAVEQEDNPEIEAIHYLGEELDLTDPYSYDLTIDFLKDCKDRDCEICDTCKSGIAEFLFGTTFISTLEKIHDTVNDTTDTLIKLLTDVKNTVIAEYGIPPKCCDECCTCKDVKCPVKEEEVEDDSDEEASNTRTLYWAQQYMDTVIDPKSELSDADFNTFLAMFTQYGDWLLNQ